MENAYNTHKYIQVDYFNFLLLLFNFNYSNAT